MAPFINLGRVQHVFEITAEGFEGWYLRLYHITAGQYSFCRCDAGEAIVLDLKSIKVDHFLQVVKPRNLLQDL